VRTCVSNRDADLQILKLLHAVDILCINYYEAFQRKNRANSWNGALSPLADGVSRQQGRNKKSVGISCVQFPTLQFGFRPDSSKLLRRRSQQSEKAAVRAYDILRPALEVRS
jgi:hypothetical protein